MADMTKELNLYKQWREASLADKDLVLELESIEGKEEEILDRFYTELAFGTAGLRGVIGAGTNRMNIYTVGRATQGLCDYLNLTVKNPTVAIAYDSRIKSDLFARRAAEIFAANGIKVNIYKTLMPVPMVSFATRELKCDAGIIVTASHNPAKYNGYKVYDPTGCQIGPEVANAVIEKISKVDYFTGIKAVDFDEAMAEGKISYIAESVIEKYFENVLAQQINKGLCENAGFKLVYSPLNGAGNMPVREILKRIGINDVTVVPEQEKPDGNFTTCPFPNPEMKDALKLGIELCEKTGADMLLATDPDCDRVGIAVKGDNGYELFSGNEVGALLLEYIASCRIANGTMPKNPVAVKTIVTSEIVTKIAEKYGVELRNVLTGFKFIGEQIASLEKDGEMERYILGFEESYGYLVGGYVRDKDAVVASMLICEMAAYYKTKGKTLIDVRREMYEEYGCYLNTLGNFYCEGASGMERMSAIMTNLRSNAPADIGGIKITKIADYEKSTETDIASGAVTEIKLPKSNVLAYTLETGDMFIVRPSGTEPKIKVYYTTIGETFAKAEEKSSFLSEKVTKLMGL